MLLCAAQVQLGPFAVPIEGDAVGSFVELVYTLKLVKLDITKAFDIEESEGDLVLGVRLVEQVFEVQPVCLGNLSFALAIGYFEQDAVLFP